MKVKVWVKTNKVKSLVEKIVEVDKEDYNFDLFAESALEEDMRQEMLDMIMWDYEILE